MKRLQSLTPAWIFSIFWLWLSLLQTPGLAALTGNIEGQIFDQTRARVPGANLSLRDAATGLVRSQTSDAEGRFSFQQLPPGTYDLTVQVTGFKPLVLQVASKSAETAKLSITLDITNVAPVMVDVTDSAGQQLDTTNGQLQTSFSSVHIQELPLLNRDILSLTALSPGIVPVAPTNRFLATGSYNSNGGRGRGNNLTIDSVTATDVTTTGSAGFSTLSIDTVQEFKLITNGFTPEFGRNASSQAQVITRSGTNTLHGSLYEFFQNGRLNARDFFDTTGRAAPLRRNQYGLTLGGPLRKDRTFAFGHFEGLQLRGGGGTRVATVPTPDAAASITDPTSLRLFQQYQVPTSSLGTVSNAAGTASRTASLSLRLDHQLGPKDTLAARFGWANNDVMTEALTFSGTNLSSTLYVQCE